MLIHEIRKSKGYNKKSKRLGRGNSSGKGNYSTRGIKGQLSRSGGGMPSWFEGGQTPLTQRLPKKRGFKRYYKLITEYSIINLDQLQVDNRINNGDKITKELLVKLGYIKKQNEKVKILGRLKKVDKFNKKLIFEGIESFSEGAKKIILEVGGQII